MATPAVPGLYGKLPAAGDFVSRRLPGDFVKIWDAWLQEALVTSRDQLNEEWLDVYLTSPIWRFATTPGSAGEKAAMGILMPSVDRVGRYFPLTLATMLDAQAALPYLFVAAGEWFDALEQLALSALEDGSQLEALDRELQTLPLDPPQPAGDDPRGEREALRGLGDAPIRIEMETIGDLPQAFGELGARLLMRHYRPAYSLWSTEGSDLLRPSLLVYGGLPPATDFSGFLTGEWLRFGEGPAVSVSPCLLPSRSSPPDSAGTAAEIDATPGLRWRSHGRSDVGRIRVVNEDAFLENPQKGVWAVADGMGGHLAGDLASRAVVDELRTVAPQNGIESLIADVNACLQRTNAALLRRSQEDAEGQIMGSTVVILLAVANHCATLWAGDSRLYRFRGGRLSQLTRDHSPDAEGEPAEDRSPEKENSSNVVTRALGAEDDLAVDTVVFEADPGDTYLLCSDGLVKEVNPREIADILSQADPEQSSRALIDLALARGARDNVTVVVVVADQEPAQAPDADPP